MKRGGYTLVEIVVVIGVVGILSGVALGYNRMANSNLALFKTQALLVGYLNRAKSLSQQRLNLVRVCAYGIHFPTDGSGFLIFGDVIESAAQSRCRDVDGVYTGNGFYEEESDLVVDTPMILDPGVSLNEEVLGHGIIFLPPDLTASTTFKQADDTIGLPLTVIISIADSSRTVSVGEGGQISVNE